MARQRKAPAGTPQQALSPDSSQGAGAATGEDTFQIPSYAGHQKRLDPRGGLFGQEYLVFKPSRTLEILKALGAPGFTA